MLINYSKIFKKNLFDKTKEEKEIFFLKNLKKLHNYHQKNSKEYLYISKTLFKNNMNKIENFPFLHVQMFKEKNLKSVPNNVGVKTFNSSGTSGKKLSMINIDMKTSLLQSKTLSRILLSVLKEKVDKIYFIDSETTLKTMQNSARGAAILGFKQIANSSEFILDSEYNVKKNIIKKIITDKKKICFFGFTSLVWLNFLNFLKKNKIFLKKKDTILFHGGGWKKIEKNKVSRNKFNLECKNYIGSNKIYNYYGMIEQTGSIFLECEYGLYHPSLFSEIIIRDENMMPCKPGKMGIIQVFSLLPVSYPGHSILTEDLGVISKIDTCKCGRKGKAFKVLNRIKDSEVRGCSDVY
jgi:phenylacetate-coenzyme A ligase PaaK-like adenylate-forming protein